MCLKLDKKEVCAYIQQIATGGLTPKNFNRSPDNHFLLVANQDSDDICLFKRDPVTGY